MAIAPGTKFGPYTIGQPLGAGGMGEVYEATDTRLGRQVAVKVLNLGELDPERERGLEREARAVAKLNHPNICVLHDVGHHEGRCFLVMERLSGETLAQRLQRAPLPLADALSIGVAIADALDAAHRARILHRDLKPSNVMLTKSGPKLLDFGLATRDASSQDAPASDTRQTASLSVAHANTFAGTLPYMAPELLDGKPADVRSDIFALGAVLYEMVSGRPAFEGTTAALLAAILTKDPDPVGGLPAPVDRVIRRCLAKDPEERWQSARDLREALTLVQGNPPAVSTSADHRRPRLWPVAAIVVLLAAIVGSVLWFRPEFVGSASRPGEPVVVLMDSTLPERVYDPRTRKEGATNADDITDILRDLPVELHKETTSPAWHREDEVLKQRPSLIMMHLSSFAEPTNDPERPLQQNAQERTRSFLGYIGLAEQQTRFVVYSRGFAEEAESAAWVAETELRFPALRGRVQLLHIPGGNAAASFRDPQTAKLVRERVKALLNLR